MLPEFSQTLSFHSHIHPFPPSSFHLLVVRRNVLPSGPGTCSISCFAREQGGERQERRRRSRRRGEQRGTEPEEETHTEKEKQRDGERGREGGKEERLNAGLVRIHLALISQTERVMVREETEGLLFLALLGI